MPYIELKKAGYKYPKGTFSIRDISIGFFNGEFTAIIGHNGSGKTTIGKLAAGIFKPDSGSVLIDGKDTTDMSLGEIGRKIGYLFQNPDRQIFTPSVYEEIAFALELKGLHKKDIDRSVHDALDMFNISHLENSIPFKLSRGEKQRLALAAMLVHNPGFLILDEPTTGLDMERRAVLSGIVDKLRCQGIGMIAISHDEAFIKRHADRIITVHGGEIVDDCKR